MAPRNSVGTKMQTFDVLLLASQIEQSVLIAHQN